LAVWQRFDGSMTVVQAVARDAAGPQMRGLSVPVAGTVRQPVAFAVTPFDVWSATASTVWSFGDDAGGVGGADVTHSFLHTGNYDVSVTSEDAVGNSTTASGTITIFAKASAKRIVLVHGRQAVIKLHCPSILACSGQLRLVAAVAVHGPGGRRHRRAPVARRAFEIPGKRVSPLRALLTAAGRDAVIQAGGHGLNAQLTGPGVKHRRVLLLARRGAAA
jgi:hypothetical protein